MAGPGSDLWCPVNVGVLFHDLFNACQSPIRIFKIRDVYPKYLPTLINEHGNRVVAVVHGFT
jgi:hypothetical protein